MKRVGLRGMNGKTGDPPPERRGSGFQQAPHFASPARDPKNQQWGGKRASEPGGSEPVTQLVSPGRRVGARVSRDEPLRRLGLPQGAEVPFPGSSGSRPRGHFSRGGEAARKVGGVSREHSGRWRTEG